MARKSSSDDDQGNPQSAGHSDDLGGDLGDSQSARKGGDNHPQESVSKADRELFRESVGPLRRIHSDRPPDTDEASPRPVPTFSRADEEEVLGELLSPIHDSDFGEAFYAQPGLQTRTIRKLKRGQFRIDAELDLHAMTESTARRTLVEFLNACQKEDSRCVRVIHGKGLRSGTEGPVIKPMVERELRQRKQVLAFCSARPVHGGSGAVYVLLRRG